MSLETMISTYGYPVIAIGTFLEGETILVIAGFAAHQGYLKFSGVLFWAFMGTLCGDQLYFHLGRTKGIKLLDKRPYWRSKSVRVFDILHKHPLPLVLGFRFLYGMRTVTPFLLGASGFSPVRFMILNVFGALLWTVAVGGVGFLFGRAVELLIGRIEHYEAFFFIVLGSSGAFLWFVFWYRRKRLEKKLKTAGT